ncbi:hypothetical protein [Streptomyces gobitricini]|uniref:Uncharacterized protein n=1 Tax=Streptomyces gobitricini TaxID=68211 RepID=A0ABN3M7M0_9ACTN
MRGLRREGHRRRRLVRFLASGADNDTSRAKVGADLIPGFQTEVMGAYGYVRVDNPAPAAEFPLHTGMPPKGVR